MKNNNTIDSGWLEQVTGGSAHRASSVSRLGTGSVGGLGTLGLGTGSLGALGLGGLGLGGLGGGLFGNHALVQQLRDQKQQQDTMTALCLGIACSRR